MAVDINALINKAVSALKGDSSLKSLFGTDPTKAIQKILGVDLSDDVVKKVVEGVTKVLGEEKATGILVKIKSFFCKKG